MDTIISQSVQHRGVVDLKTAFERIFNLQKANQQKVADTNSQERKLKLERLRQAVMKYHEQIREALYKDYKKPASEVDIGEIYKITSDIKYAKSNLPTWMRPRKVATPMAQIGSSSYIHFEPKGVVLIISSGRFIKLLRILNMPNQICQHGCGPVK